MCPLWIGACMSVGHWCSFPFYFSETRIQTLLLKELNDTTFLECAVSERWQTCLWARDEDSEWRFQLWPGIVAALSLPHLVWPNRIRHGIATYCAKYFRSELSIISLWFRITGWAITSRTYTLFRTFVTILLVLIECMFHPVLYYLVRTMYGQFKHCLKIYYRNRDRDPHYKVLLIVSS